MRWLLHLTLLGAVLAIGVAFTWADEAQIVVMRVRPGTLSVIAWSAIAFYTVITTLLVRRAKDGARVVAAHVIGAVTAPAVTWLAASVLFAVYKGVEKSHGH